LRFKKKKKACGEHLDVFLGEKGKKSRWPLSLLAEEGGRKDWPRAPPLPVGADRGNETLQQHLDVVEGKKKKGKWDATSQVVLEQEPSFT